MCLFVGVSGECVFYRVEVRNPPDSGKDTAQAKGSCHEAESEEMRLISGLTNRNCIEDCKQGQVSQIK